MTLLNSYPKCAGKQSVIWCNGVNLLALCLTRTLCDSEKTEQTSLDDGSEQRAPQARSRAYVLRVV
jgi:hypothetical protein